MIRAPRFHGHDGERSEVQIGWTFLARPYWGGSFKGRTHPKIQHSSLRYYERETTEIPQAMG
jgi:hypothetical protein